MELFTEGGVEFFSEKVEILTKKSLFFNSLSVDRDFSVAFVESLDVPSLNIAYPFAGTGIRALRFLKISNKDVFVDVNDASSKAVDVIKKNFELNNVPEDKFRIFNDDGNRFLINNRSHDFIDMDCFGYPGFFLDAALKRVMNGGFISLKATDTAALCGVFNNACRRKYFARSYNNYLCQEFGLRIFIRFIQLMGCVSGKALIPVFGFNFMNYNRMCFQVFKSKTKCDEILALHKLLFFNRETLTVSEEVSKGCVPIGPLWTGDFCNVDMLKKMKPLLSDHSSLVDCLISEQGFGVGFFDSHEICSLLSLKFTPKISDVFEALKNKGFDVVPTHFSFNGFRTNAPSDVVFDVFKNLC